MHVRYIFTYSGGLLTPKSGLRPVQGKFRGRKIVFEVPIRISNENYIPRPHFNFGNAGKLGIKLKKDGPPMLYISISPENTVVLTVDEIPDNALNDIPRDCFFVTIKDSKDSPENRSLATDFIEKITMWLRILTHQYWVGRSIENYGDISGTLDLKNNFELSNAQFEGLHYIMPGSDFRMASQEMISDAVKKVCGSEKFPLGPSIESDVYHFATSNDMRMTVILLSSYVEVLRDAVLEKAGKKVGHLGVAATNLPHHLSRGFAKIFGRNLETEDLICFKFLKSLWRCRNEVAHGQPFLWIEDDVTIVPDEEFKMHFLKKGFCIIKWLRSVEDDYRPGA